MEVRHVTTIVWDWQIFHWGHYERVANSLHFLVGIILSVIYGLKRLTSQIYGRVATLLNLFCIILRVERNAIYDMKKLTN